MRKMNSKAHSLDSFRTEPEQLSDPPTPRGANFRAANGNDLSSNDEELIVESSAMGGYDAVAFSTNDNKRNEGGSQPNGPRQLSSKNSSGTNSVGNESFSYGERRERVAQSDAQSVH